MESCRQIDGKVEEEAARKLDATGRNWGKASIKREDAGRKTEEVGKKRRDAGR